MLHVFSAVPHPAFGLRKKTGVAIRAVHAQTFRNLCSIVLAPWILSPCEGSAFHPPSGRGRMGNRSFLHDRRGFPCRSVSDSILGPYRLVAPPDAVFTIYRRKASHCTTVGESRRTRDYQFACRWRFGTEIRPGRNGTRSGREDKSKPPNALAGGGRGDALQDKAGRNARSNQHCRGVPPHRGKSTHLLLGIERLGR